MSRPRPLSIAATGSATDYQSQALTPRTPHSRSGRAEEAGIAAAEFSQVDLDQISEDDESDFDDDNIRLWSRQEEPLLANAYPPGSVDNIDPSRVRFAKWTGLDLATVLRRLPVVIGLVMFMALMMIFMLSLTDSPARQRHVHKSHHHNGTIKEALILYEQYDVFPLRPEQYLSECIRLNTGLMMHGDYWDTMGMHAQIDVIHDESLDDVCSSTITYQLGTAGLIADLALMSQAAALARERNRTFFVDDTYWNRGKWLDHFEDVRTGQPGPEPNCKAPPPDELVACPRFARHWVINYRTAKYHFGHAFDNHYENAYGHALARAKPLFKNSVISFRDTIKPSKQNRELIHAARGALVRVLYPESVTNLPPNYSYISVHLRRGDRLAQSWPFHKGYVPLANFVESVNETWARVYSVSSPPTIPPPQPTVVYVASDSPEQEAELISMLSTDTWVFSLRNSGVPELRPLASPMEYVQKTFMKLAEKQRVLATRGMIVDFALLSGSWMEGDVSVSPLATICTISSNVCKMTAVGLGWDRAFGGVDEMGLMNNTMKAWVEIDEKGNARPVWQPFELF